MSTPLPASHMAFVRAYAGRSTELGARLSILVEPGRQTPGCLQFALQHSLSEPDLWLISGSWSSEQAMRAWFNSPALGILSQLVNDMMIIRMDFQTYSDASASFAQPQYPQLHQLAS